MLVRDLHHVSINVTDVERAATFYTGVLGLARLARPDFGFHGAWLGLPGGRQIHLIQADVPTDLGQHFAFQVDDLDAAIATLRSHDVEVRGPFAVGDSPARQAFLADPDGNRLELNQSG
ncbi:MAG: VOC family protein [Actinomycetota bacterium]|nr:VOC family protein [Acidimicrobiia bacterium]MDQ3469505.1 VOC family protein [Actinomycetota bacterium]